MGEVVARRVDRLPQPSADLLRTAAVIGREFDLPALASASGRSEDQALDDLDPAVGAGLVREEGVGRFSFAHALTRDALYDGLRPTRRARVHARVAAALAVPFRAARARWPGTGERRAR